MWKRTIATVTALVAVLGLVSCSSSHFDKIPQKTGFFTHLEKNPYKQVPLDAYWSAGMTEAEWDQRVTGANSQGVKVRVLPVSLNYLANRPSDSKEMAKIVELKQYFDRALMKELQKVSDNPKNHFHLVQSGGPGVFTMETAILSVKPAVVNKNAAMKVLGMAAGTAGTVANYVLGKDDDKGFICIATRFRNPSGRVICESAKYMAGQSSILGYDLKDFQSYAHQKSSIDDWVKLVGESFVSKSDATLSLPWFKLNPF